MIGRLRGVVWDVGEELCLIDVAGVGYEVLVPGYLRDAVDSWTVGQSVQFEIYYHVSERQPRPTLIGFATSDERAFFEAFISVSGIGPMTAAKALVLPVGEVAAAIEAGDVGVLRRLEGIGARTAEKIVAALKGKVTAYATVPAAAGAAGDGSSAERGRTVPLALEREALEVLEQLGYRRAEAMRMIEEAISHEAAPADAEALIQTIFARAAGGR